MAETNTEMKQTLGLTGLTMNAMALIAPGAFLWLTFAGQAAAGSTAPSMWIGILFATVLCLATAVCYAEMAKLYPGTGSSYYFAEQSFLNHETAWPYARLAKFIVGRRCVFVCRGLHRSSGHKRFDFGEHRHQCHSDQRFALVRRGCPELPHEPSTGQHRLPV